MLFTETDPKCTILNVICKKVSGDTLNPHIRGGIPFDPSALVINLHQYWKDEVSCFFVGIKHFNLRLVVTMSRETRHAQFIDEICTSSRTVTD